MSVWDKKNNSKGVGRSVFFVNTTQPRIPWEDSLMEELSWSGLPTGMFVWDYLEYLNWCGKTQPESGWYRFPGSGLWTVSERREVSTKAVLFTVDMRSWSRFLPWRRYNDGHLNCDLKATLPPGLFPATERERGQVRSCHGFPLSLWLGQTNWSCCSWIYFSCLCLYLCVFHLSLGFHGGQRWYQSPWSWSYRRCELTGVNAGNWTSLLWKSSQLQPKSCVSYVSGNTVCGHTHAHHHHHLLKQMLRVDVWSFIIYSLKVWDNHIPSKSEELPGKQQVIVNLL